MPSFFDPKIRAAVEARIRRLAPAASPRWGRMTAPAMVAHLTDQMRHTLGDATTAPIAGPLRNPVIRYFVIHWLPWPRGRVKGPPEAFLTKPVDWSRDVEVLVGLVARFGRRDPTGPWPEHAIFGPMSGRDWAHFCHKHFHHHLTQFGV